jgi:hypothetical protein
MRSLRRQDVLKQVVRETCFRGHEVVYKEVRLLWRKGKRLLIRPATVFSKRNSHHIS